MPFDAQKWHAIFSILLAIINIMASRYLLNERNCYRHRHSAAIRGDDISLLFTMPASRRVHVLPSFRRYRLDKFIARPSEAISQILASLFPRLQINSLCRRRATLRAACLLAEHILRGYDISLHRNELRRFVHQAMKHAGTYRSLVDATVCC